MAESDSYRYRVRVTNDALMFCAAHFITYGENVCERLHGHNYRVTAEVLGPLEQNQYVFDFIALRETLRELTQRLDHYVLLPTGHPAIRVMADEQSVQAVFEERRWLFPRGDCVLLPVANTTAEELARYLGEQLLERLAADHGFRPVGLRIEVEECAGQSASCEFG